ncbi:GNAT family N-acetyltransferase [Ferroacidibacillus organovorans]|nr:GNAT family N-acetyltransferase [Ferroacidibacillus organovorans]
MQPTKRRTRRRSPQRAKTRLPNRKQIDAGVGPDHPIDDTPTVTFLARPFHPMRDSERVGHYHVELMNVQKKLWSELAEGNGAKGERQGALSRSSPAQEGQMWARQIAQMTGRGEAHVLMLETTDHQTVGYAFVAESPDPLTNERMGVVGELFVEEAWRKKGVGSHALRAAERWLATRGIHAVQIFVTRTNVPAVDLYQKNGYSTYDYRMVKQLDSRVPDAR